MLGFDPFGFANSGLAENGIVPPEVTICRHRAVSAGALEDDDGLDRFAAAERNAFIDGWFERELLATATLLVSGDHGHGASIVNPVAYRLRRKAAEDHRVNGANPGTGQHGYDAFNSHRHIDDDAIAFLDATGAQTVGQLANLLQ